MRLPGWLWLIWAAEGLLFEGIAIGTKAPGDTLTERIMDTFPALAVVMGVAWVGLHFGIRAWGRWRDG